MPTPQQPQPSGDRSAQFFAGEYQELAAVSPDFARKFGTASSRLIRPISQALIQQYKKHPEVFDEADNTLELWEAAQNRDTHLYTLVYGVPAAMAEAFAVTSSFELCLLIDAGEFEPDVLEALLDENEGKKLPAGMFRDAPATDAYSLRATFCSAFLGVDSAYALLMSGIRPSADYKDVHKVIDCIILGVDPHYAMQTRGRIDPPAVVKAYRDGVAAEYLMGTL